MADLKGKVERVRDNRVEGWAFEEGAEPVALALYIDGVRVAKGRAKSFRKDLAKAGVGDGNCGFAFEVPQEFQDGRAHKILVRAIDGRKFASKGSLMAVLGTAAFDYEGEEDVSPAYDAPAYETPSFDVLSFGVSADEAVQTQTMAAPVLADLPVVMPKKLRGRLEGLKKGRVVGWACNMTKPDPVKLALFIDGVHVASQRARAPRKDLLAKGFNEGLHGFQFDIPAQFRDGQQHVAEVRRADDLTTNLFAPLSIVLP